MLVIVVEDEDVNIPFSVFYNQYDKKRGNLKKLEKQWTSLKPLEREKVMEILPAYIASTPDKQFRKDPENYLKQRAWENEILVKPIMQKKGKIDSSYD